MSKIETGNKVPEFSLPVTGGGTWRLKEAAGRKRVIYFYPRDMTSGCTREAQDFRDLYGAFRKAGVDVVGASRDSVASHKKLAAKDGSGRLRQEWPKVKVPGHAEAVLEAARSL